MSKCKFRDTLSFDYRYEIEVKYCDDNQNRKFILEFERDSVKTELSMPYSIRMGLRLISLHEILHRACIIIDEEGNRTPAKYRVCEYGTSVNPDVISSEIFKFKTDYSYGHCIVPRDFYLKYPDKYIHEKVGVIKSYRKIDRN